jgi:hypothetical protein
MVINTGVGELTPVPEGPVSVFDNPLGLEIYCEGPQGIFQAGDMISIALYSPRSDPDGKVYRTIVARITLPIAGANMLATDLLDFLDKSSIARRVPPGN